MTYLRKPADDTGRHDARQDDERPTGGDESTVAVTVPAFASDTLGETLTVRVPEAWTARVRALGAFCEYGPTFRRGVVEALADVDRCVRNGYSLVAYDHLLTAERIGGVARPSGE